MAEHHPTDNPPAVWPPPVARPASVASPPAGIPILSLLLDVTLYVLVWSFIALAFLVPVVQMNISPGPFIPWYQFGLPDGLAWLIAFLLWTPFNVIWLVCVACFGLLHRHWLSRLEKDQPSAGSPKKLLVRSRRVGMGAGLVQAAIVCVAAVMLHVPQWLEGYSIQDDKPEVFHDLAYDTYMMLWGCGIVIWLASVAGGWLMGVLWARRASRTP